MCQHRHSAHCCSRTPWPTKSPFKHKQWPLILLVTLFTLSATLATEVYGQQNQQLIRRHSQTTSSSSNNNNKRHLSSQPVPASSAAEYFYANDKLADDQVAHFVSSLGIQNGSSPATASYSPFQRPSSGQSPVGGSRVSASSVFPASLVSRATLPAHSSSSPFSSTSQHAHSSLPGHTSPELSPSKPSLSEGANSSTRQSKPLSINNVPMHSTAIRSHPVPEFDFSWVQPVYVAKANASADDKLQLNAFKSDPIDLFPIPSSNLTINRTMLSTPSSTESNDHTKPTTELEDRLESFSAALANVTFSLRDEQWVAPIIALSMLNIMVIMGFECFVIYRACRTCPSRRHLFLGQMLLLGLFLSSVMGIAFVPNSNWLTCTLIRAGVGICFAIVYGTLLVKTVFLLSLHTGVYLSAEYQALLLFFIISTQVAIDAQWLMHKTSYTVIDYMDGYGHAVYKCDHSINQLLLSLIYVMILIVLIAVMAFRVRGYRENHGEALFIGITATCTIVLWFVWIAGTITSTPHYRDGFVAFGLVCNATLIFIVMFLPKGRQLAAVGREGHLDDRDQLSTASSPSIYTPSFLHIKPVSQLIPLGKPSIAGLSSVVSGGVSSGLNGGPGGYLYKQFQGTGTTLTSPMSTTGPPGPLTGNHAIPNSYSSHAIFASSNNKADHHQHEDEHNDPNYSNLSNVFASANPATAGAPPSNLNSPSSENHSSSSGSGSSQNSKSSGSGKSGSKLSQNSKASAASHQQMVKSASGTANADCFFYLQPPPLPPPSSRPPQPPGARDQSSRPWRQTCYTPNYHRSGHHPSSGVGLHHYPKSLAGLGSLYSHQADHVRTPMGPPNGVSSLHHHLLSPSSDNETTSFYFASFDAAGSTTRQLLSAERTGNGAGNGHREHSASHGGHNAASNFKYFRGPHY